MEVRCPSEISCKEQLFTVKKPGIDHFKTIGVLNSTKITDLKCVTY